MRLVRYNKSAATVHQTANFREKGSIFVDLTNPILLAPDQANFKSKAKEDHLYTILHFLFVFYNTDKPT